MPEQSLLDINPDKLFEERNISEIQNVHKNLQNEIEMKREQLRTMVGEKYRDLLEAADTISEMKETSQKVITHVNKITELCKTLQEKHLIGFKHHSTRSSSRFSKQTEEISRTIQIKIFISLPKEIWSAIDNKEYLLGAQLYLLATHIHLNLKVSENAKRMAETFPVVGKQWDVISSCRKVLIDGAKNELKVVDISAEKAVICLSSLLLLEVISTEELLSHFLELRKQALLHILKSDELKTVKSKINYSVQLLQHTLALVYFVFLYNGKRTGLLYKEVEAVTSPDSPPTLTKLNQTVLFSDKYLSPLISEFRPKATKKLEKISQEALRHKIERWMEVISDILEKNLNPLLKFITSVKKIYNIRQEIFDLKNIHNWDDITVGLINRKLDVWQFFLRKLVTRRFLELIETNWEDAINKVQECFRKINEELIKERNKQPENDIRWFVWKENINDILTSEASVLKHSNNLLLKTQGFTPHVVELCTCLDNQLESLLSDISLYIEDKILLDLNQDCQQDSLDIINFLNQCSLAMMKRLTENIKSRNYFKDQAEQESSVILRARFLQAVLILCPHLEKCLKQIHRIEQGEVTRCNSWQELCLYLNEESTAMWKIWKISTRQKFQKMINYRLNNKHTLRSLLRSKPQNEVITIEEQTEDGKNVKSDIRVPSQPSMPLQDVLFSICQHLNAVAPHTLPRKIHQELVDSIVSDIFENYEKSSDIMYQSQSLQLLLDVKVLTLLFVSTDNKELSNRSQELCERFEKTIDPFDLNVYYLYLQNNIKRSVQRLQTTLGILINFNDKLAVLNGLKLTACQKSLKTEEPNILAMSTNIPWFPPLHISSPGSNKAKLKEMSPNKILGSAAREVKRESSPASAAYNLLSWLKS